MQEHIRSRSLVKMQCSIILLTLVALCYSVPIVIKHKHITLDDNGNITIEGSQGRKIVISKVEESTGQRNVAIFMEDDTGPVIRTWFKEQSTMEDTKLEVQKGMTEEDILVEIFKKYQGDIDIETYKDILEQIRPFVRTRLVDVNVFNILKSFDVDIEQTSDITDLEDSSDVSSLKKLVKLLRSLGMTHDTMDIYRLVRKDPVFLDRLVNQDPSLGINEEDIMYLNTLRQNQQKPMGMVRRQNPMSLGRLRNTQREPLGLYTPQQKQAMIAMEQDIPLFTEQDENPRMTREELINMQLMKIMQDPKYQRLFMKPETTMRYDAMKPDVESLYRMKYGKDMNDQSRDPMMTDGEENVMTMKEMDPEMLNDKMTTQQWMPQVDQMDQHMMLKRLRDQMMSRQGNQWQKRNSLITPRDRSMMDRRNMMMDRMMMGRMMPMMQ